MKKAMIRCLSILVLTWPMLSYAEVYIQQVIPYRDASRIDNRITTECHRLGADFSTYIEKNAEKNGVKLLRTEADLSAFPNRAEIEIESAMSAGNAFVGHAKGVSVYARLYRDGEVVDSTTFSRNSMGGFMGGFKSSCSVLDRTVNTLGKDIAQWLSRHQKP